MSSAAPTPRMPAIFVPLPISVGPYVPRSIVVPAPISTWSPISTYPSCALSLCPESNLDTAGRNGSYQTLAFVGLGVGVIGLATGAYLYLTSNPEPRGEQPVADVSIGPGRVLLRGRF